MVENPDTSVKCPICAAVCSGRYRTSPYWMCPACDCWFQDPLPPKMYEGPHEKAAQEGVAGMSEGDKAVNKALAAELFRSWIKKPARTLDIGSKYPYLAYCLQELGCEAHGMDNLDNGAEYSRDLGVPMWRADFEAASEEETLAWTRDGKFSLITLVHVFEHLYNPLEALRKLRSLLAEDGVLFLRLPDHGVPGFERDLTSSHYTIHPFFHSLTSLLELLVHGQDLFTVQQTYPLQGAGQRDLILKPLTKKPLVLAGLIVKNEARDLPRCLQSIEAAVDGVVLVDTGSTDTTLEVAMQAARCPIFAQIYTGASRRDATGDWKIWDFSAARNVFVQEIEARGADYVLWMDADDELLTPAVLRRAVYWTQYDVFGVCIESGRSRWTHHRLWKTRRGIRFEGRCHEYPTYGGHAVHVFAEAVVRHHSEPSGGESSNARNMRILLEEFSDQPSPRTAFYLANTFKDAKRYEEAVLWYDKRIAFGNGYLDEWLFAHLYKARCQHWSKNFRGARSTLYQALAVAGDWSEFWMELAHISYSQRIYDDAIGYALIARDKPQPATELWRETHMYTDQPPRLISWCYEHKGDFETALTWAYLAQDKIIGPDGEWEDRIERLQEEVEEAAQDKSLPVKVVKNTRKIAICRAGAIGDVLMTLNLIPLLRRKWPSHGVHYYCHPTIGSALKSVMLSAGVTEVCDSNRSAPPAEEYEKIFHLVGYPLQEGYPEKPMQRHLLEYFAKELDLGETLPALPVLRLPLPPRPLEISGPYATLQVKTGWSAYKEWSVDRWAQVVKACPDIPIYQIGKGDEPLVEGARHDFMGLPLEPTIAFFANAAMHLGLDSYANHLSHYLWDDGYSARRVPAVILWGSTQVSALGYPHNKNISLGLSCQPCFRENPAISSMPRGPCINPPGQVYSSPCHACMGGIEVDQVVQAVRQCWALAIEGTKQP